MVTAAEVIAADAVGRSFRGRRVLTAATVSGHAGEIVAVLGRNGSGKTTLLRILAGVIAADWGMVRVHGEVVRRPRLHRLAERGVFYLPERKLLSVLLTVTEHFDRIAARFGVDPASGIEALGVGGLLDRGTTTLSTGERRRVEVALAFARKPACLIADEPFLGIAPKDAERVANAMRTLAADGSSVLVTGHEVSALLDMATTVTWLSAGTTHALGTPAEALSHHSFRRDYLGPAR